MLFSGQHAALMAVRPDADIYKMLEQVLCKVTGPFVVLVFVFVYV